MGYRNAQDELKHRIVIDGLLNSMALGGSVVITDYSIFDLDRCITGGAYWFAIEYKKIKYCTFMAYYRTSSKYFYCSKCGKFECSGKCGKHRIVPQHDVIKAIQDVWFLPEYRIEYRMEENQ